MEKQHNIFNNKNKRKIALILIVAGLGLLAVGIIAACENPIIKQWYASKEKKQPPSAPVAPLLPPNISPTPTPTPVVPPDTSPVPAPSFVLNGTVTLNILPAFADRYELRGLRFNIGGETVVANYQSHSSVAGRWNSKLAAPNVGEAKVLLGNGETRYLPAVMVGGSGDFTTTVIPIGSAEELDAIRGSGGYPLDGRYIQYADIDASSIAGWQAIGEETEPFTGTYNGGNYTITNLQSAGSAGDKNWGLFRILGPEGSLLNIRVASAVMSGFQNVGGICGTNLSGEIRDCSFSGTLNSTNLAGGIAAVVIDGSISGCVSAGTITNTGLLSGGIAALAADSTSIEDCLNKGEVSSQGRAGGIAGAVKLMAATVPGNAVTIANCENSGNIKGGAKIGGIAGEVAGGGTIRACLNTGGVSGDKFSGGIAGWVADSAIAACRNSGTVKNVQDCSGGIAGYSKDNDIVACYNTGFVQSKATAGGIVAFNEGNGTVHACYNIGNVISLDKNFSPNQGLTGWIIADNGQRGAAFSVQACYWIQANASPFYNGIGKPRSDDNAKEFGSDSGEPPDPWPQSSTHTEWGIGSGGSGGWWKHLGSPTDGHRYPEYPTLYWE